MNSLAGRNDFFNQTFSVDTSKSRTSLCLSIAVFQKHDNQRSPHYQQNTLHVFQSNTLQLIPKFPTTKLHPTHLTAPFLLSPNDQSSRTKWCVSCVDPVLPVLITHTRSPETSCRDTCMYPTSKTRFGFRSIETKGCIVYARSLMEDYALTHEGGSVIATFVIRLAFRSIYVSPALVSCLRPFALTHEGDRELSNHRHDDMLDSI